MRQNGILPAVVMFMAALSDSGEAAAQTQLNVWRNDGNALLAKFTNYATSLDRTALIDIQNGHYVLWRYGVGGAGNGLGLTNHQFYIERYGYGSALTIDYNGNVAIGKNKTSDGYRAKILHGTWGLNLENQSTGHDWEIYTSSATTDPTLSLYYNKSFRGSFNAVTGVYTSISDERQKTNIKAMPSVLEKVNQLKPTTYQFRNGAAATGTAPEAYGFLAQDVMKVFPHLVTHNVDKERGEDNYSMDYSGFGVIAIKAVQELQKTVQAQEQKFEQQQQQNANLRKQVDDLTALVHQLSNTLNAGGANTKAVLTSAQMDLVGANPAKGSASISYSLPQGTGKAQLVVTDATGRIIKSLPLTASGTVHLDTSTLSSGVYNYALVIEGNILLTKKLVVAN